MPEAAQFRARAAPIQVHLKMDRFAISVKAKAGSTAMSAKAVERLKNNQIIIAKYDAIVDSPNIGESLKVLSLKMIDIVDKAYP